MRTILILIAGTVTVALLAYVIYLFNFQKPPDSAPPSSSAINNSYSISMPNSTPVPSAATSIVETEVISDFAGNAVRVTKFSDKLEKITDSHHIDHWYLGYDATATNTLAYVAEYFSDNTSFAIYLQHEPIGEARSRAEEYLSSILGISQTQFCQLRYGVTVPYSVNPIYSGKNLGFSFCPGSTKF